jgi:Fic family protein
LKLPDYLLRYPFLNFASDLSKAPFQLWILLGEAKSKCAHIANAPLLPEVREWVHRVYLAKGVQATTAIEGNTLSEEEVLAILENRSKSPPSRAYLEREVRNVLDACNKLLKMDYQQPLRLANILDFNRWVLEGLDLPAEVTPGELRKHNVTVASYRPPEAEYMLELMEGFTRWLNDFPKEISPGFITETAILKSILAHLYLVWIHPFGDGNGRAARLLEWYVLLSGGVPTPAANLLSNHYNATRIRYYRELDLAKKDTHRFILYALEGFIDGLKEQIEVIQEQQMSIIWSNLVHETIPGEAETAKRRREIALELVKQDKPVTTDKITSLSPRLLALYISKSSKTLSRDLNWLEDHQFIRHTPEGYLPRVDRVFNMLPPKLN